MQGASPGSTLSPVTSDPICCVTSFSGAYELALSMLEMLQAQRCSWWLPAAVNIEWSQPVHSSYWGTVSTACDLRNAFWTAVKFLKDSAKTRSQACRALPFPAAESKERKGSQDSVYLLLQMSCAHWCRCCMNILQLQAEVDKVHVVPPWNDLFSIPPLFWVWTGF